MLQLHSMNMLEKKTIIVDNLSIRYYQSADFWGSGVLVFLHGWGSQAMHFSKTLEKCHNVVALDLPGFGESEMPGTAWAIRDYAGFLRHFLEKLHIERPILTGHSFGGNIAIKYCAEYGDVEKLILIGSAGIRRKTLKKLLYFILAKVLKVIAYLPGLTQLRERVRKSFYTAIGSEDYIQSGALMETYRKNIGEDLRKDMKKIKVPTTIIWGENDAMVPVADGKLTQEHIKGSQMFVIPGAGHYVFLDKEKEFEEIFLKALS
ncbi:MAG: alpha/beta hydrolase [Candidatus Moranbacteria bacterium]|nr:alpha/beta hydrolase [Candidatus Moranbacteria bacterium]